METLAYLHLALAYEATANSERTAGISSRERLKLMTWLKQHKLSLSPAVHLVGLTVALGFLGMASKASAAAQQGDRGKDVSALQQRLTHLGYFKGNVTGYFGSVTKEAVVQFQKDRGLTPDGIVGENTQTSLSESEQAKSKPQSEHSSDSELLQLGDRGDRVANVQQKLTAAGFSNGEQGVFDDATESAVKQFQESKGLEVDGIVGPQTLAALTENTDSELNTKSNSKRAPAKSQPWYEDKSAPLTPFTR